MVTQPPADSVYRLGTAHVVRLVAPFEVLIGIAWILTALMGMSHGWTVTLAVITVAVAVAGAYLFVRPPRVLSLTETGYVIGFVRTRGRAAARWREVDSVTSADAAGVPVLVFQLTDGGRSALPLSLLGARNGEAQREVHERLNNAYGYRRF